MSGRPSPRTTTNTAAPIGRRWVSACIRAVVGVLQALFVRQLRLRRVDGKLAVALEDKRPPDGETRGAADAETRPQDLTLGELTALLDAAPRSRSLLRYLAGVEQRLKRKDPAGLFLFEVEPKLLRAALRQLDGLAPKPPTPGLAALRARLVDAIGAHEQQEKRLELLMPRSDLMQGNKVEVVEGRASDFDRVAEQWRGKKPAQ
jgi:hypothetical protein